MKKRPPRFKGGVEIELEDDAEQMFLDALEGKIPDKDARIKQEQQQSTKRSKRTEKVPSLRIDLHGLTVDEAKQRIDQFMSSVSSQLPVEVRIITGKGRHSGEGGPVLARDIHDHILKRYRDIIDRIDESPIDVQVGGLPIRGHFDVKFRKK